MKQQMSRIFALVLGVQLLLACSSPQKEREATKLPSGPADAIVPHGFGPSLKYQELMIKDYDEMLALVHSFTKKARQGSDSDAEAARYYGRAMKLIFSRPDSDNMIAKLLPEIHRELSGMSVYDETLEALTVDAILTAKSGTSSVIAQTTALVELENILGEVKPEMANGSAAARRIVQRIHDANIDVSDEVRRERRLRGMFKTSNPSEEAGVLLKTAPKKKSNE